ncbi:WD repeat-containing protein 76 [Dipodomys merriami]|uniref:WD repeat-containing protein 76 n=1 Tax=Dipodomys merriami TaxID=94247 RepID=UPI003855C102
MPRPCAELEPKAAAKPRPQVNESKENENDDQESVRPVQTTFLGKIARVYLTPFSLSNCASEQLKCSLSQLEEKSTNAVLCKKMKLKKTPEVKMKATSSKSESTLLRSSSKDHTTGHQLGQKSSAEASVLSVDMESSDDDDVCDDNSNLDDFSGLSPYERKRLKNISENANFFASLQLSESAARLREMIKRKSPKCKRKKPKKREDEIGCRRSMRLLKVEPSEISFLPPPVKTTVEEEEEEDPLLPPGPLEMIPENEDDNELFKGLLQTWAEMSKTCRKSYQKGLSSIKSYKANLNSMVIREDTVRKLVDGSISSVAMHPSETRILVAAGARTGQIGIWDLTQRCEEGGMFRFYPHSRHVRCMYFSPANPAHILSLSYDGTLRCGDFSSAVFEEVYRNERSGLSSFDFLTEDASTLLVGHWSGHISLVDRRTPGMSDEKLSSSMEQIRTVHVHPVHRQYFITAGLRDIHIYDARCLNSRRRQPLFALTGHTKSISSAYFSPVTGNRVVTTGYDCKLSVFDSSCISSQIPLLTTIRHNTITGRWLTGFQAKWDPKQEDCFMVGSMAYPRQVNIFHETGKMVHSFLGECLASVCSINAMHPTRYILAGGNSSGKLHVFMD